ncbi:hypothetical protein NST11_09605 [Caldifermentibacillus hisashii]|jgi:hypothetical protein|uniref:hypothetical protein n=1 Tax=Caldifermentibacillus hisashii TaxID=996558 RepID=UPI0031B79311
MAINPIRTGKNMINLSASINLKSMSKNPIVGSWRIIVKKIGTNRLLTTLAVEIFLYDKGRDANILNSLNAKACVVDK